jgi:hypothetical protein
MVSIANPNHDVVFDNRKGDTKVAMAVAYAGQRAQTVGKNPTETVSRSES